MDASLKLDLVEFHLPKSNTVFKGKGNQWKEFMAEWSAQSGMHGNYAVIRHLDLSNLELSGFPTDRLAFVQCNLDGASFKHTQFKFETAFINCSIKNGDLTETSAADALFLDCDLTGIRISPKPPYALWTSVDLDGKDIPSIFSNCKMEDTTRQFLIKNHCIVDESNLSAAQHLAVATDINDKLTRIITAPILDL